MKKSNALSVQIWSKGLKRGYSPKHWFRLYFYIIVFVFPVSQTFSQSSDSVLVRVETRDGNEYIGKILGQDILTIRLKTEKLGEVTIQKADIKKMDTVNSSDIREGIHWPDNPQSTRHFFSPNGYGIKKGDGYYQNVWVLFNQVSLGVTDNFSIGLGMVPTFLFGTSNVPIWIAPRVTVPIKKDKVNMSLGGFFGTVLGVNNSGFGIAYGATTFGSRDRNCTVGVGYGYSSGGFAKTPTLSFSALVRTGPRGYFVTENYYIDTGSNSFTLLMVGGRRIVKKAGWDYGLMIPIVNNQSSFFAIPWLGITFAFGK